MDRTHVKMNPPTSSRASSVWDFKQSFQPIQPSQPSQARQASQPGQPGIEASGLQASMSAILLYRGSSPPLKAGTGRHRPPQAGSPLAPTAPGGGSSPFLKAATGRHRGDSILAPTAPGGAAKHATNPSNIDDMATFPTNRVMGRPFHGFRVPIKIL